MLIAAFFFLFKHVMSGIPNILGLFSNQSYLFKFFFLPLNCIFISFIPMTFFPQPFQLLTPCSRSLLWIISVVIRASDFKYFLCVYYRCLESLIKDFFSLGYCIYVFAFEF